VESALAWLTALLIFGAFFILFSRGIGRIGPHRFWRVGIWNYVPLLLALIGYSVMRRDWIGVTGYAVTGGIAIYCAHRLLRRDA
jgi:hypothetical protein